MKNLKINLSVVILSFLPLILNAQVGIGTTTPKATLDITSNNPSNPSVSDGILIPRINVFPTSNPSAEQNGLLVWLNTKVGNNLPGFYYWDKSYAQWVGIATNVNNKSWELTGSRGTNSTNFIGTLDENALQFKVNNQLSGKIDFARALNTSFGYQTLSLNPGERNTAIGYQTLSNNTSGGSNSALGYHSLKNNDRGWENTALGNLTLFSNTSGSRNTSIGFYSLYNNLTSQGNTATGVYSLYNNVTGNFNTSIGSYSLFSNREGSNNTVMGNYAAMYFEGNNAVSIGNFSGQDIASNEATIGNTSTTRIYGQVNWSSYSDGRIKDNVAENVPGLDFIKKLRPVTYNLNIRSQNKIINSEKKAEKETDWEGKYDIESIKQTGFIAQEVEKAAQELNYSFNGVQAPKNNNSLYSVSYATFVVPLVKAVQEQQQLIEKQNTQIQHLEQANKNLEERLKRLEQLIK